MRASLGPPLGSRLFPYHLFLRSALNPADDPTRNTEVRAPSLQRSRTATLFRLKLSWLTSRRVIQSRPPLIHASLQSQGLSCLWPASGPPWLLFPCNSLCATLGSLWVWLFLGVLDLWSGQGSYARAFIRAGAPWVLTVVSRTGVQPRISG